MKKALILTFLVYGCGSDTTPTIADFSDEEVFQAAVFLEGPATELLPRATVMRDASRRHVLTSVSRATMVEHTRAVVAEFEQKKNDARLLGRMKTGLRILEQMSDEEWKRRLSSDSFGATVALTSEIAKLQPEFLKRFAGELRSGDHLRIQAALADASAMVDSVVQTEDDLRLSADSGEKYAVNVGVVVNVASLSNVVVAISAALTVQVYLLVHASVAVSSSVHAGESVPIIQGDDPATQLQTELLVDEIATAFAR
ncbi:MAG: hypothetical protein AAF735_08100 [Myxococcota bacterium]